MLVSRLALALSVATLFVTSAHATAAPAFFKPDKGADGGHIIKPPPPGLPVKPITVSKGLTYIGHVEAHDANYDFSRDINQAAHFYHLKVAGLFAIIASECSLNVTSPTCDRYGTWPDWSHGSCQATVETAAEYGIGNGTEAADPTVKAYENVPRQCIFLAAHILSDFRRITGLGFPNGLPESWNCGPGNPTWFLLNPTGQCYSNHQAWLQWWYFALHHSTHKNPR
jgi:hypothetical protein